MSWRTRGSLLPVGVISAAVLALSGSVAAGSSTAGRGVVRPPANGRFDYQIGGDYTPLRSVKIVDRDRTAQPAAGDYNICYVNAFQTQAEQDQWWKRHHPRLLLRNSAGHLVEDPGWPGEILLDTATRGVARGLGEDRGPLARRLRARRDSMPSSRTTSTPTRAHTTS